MALMPENSRLSLTKVLLTKNTLVGLAASNPELALALQTIRMRALLRQHLATASQRPADAISYRTSGWEAAVHAASQPPQPHAEGQQAWMLHRLGLMELLMHYSAMSTNTSAPMHHHAAPEQPPAVHVDDASSQCCESRPRRRGKRSRDDIRQQGTRRVRNYALIEVHVSNSAGPRKAEADARQRRQISEGSGTDCSARTRGQPIEELARLACRCSAPSADMHECSSDTDSELEDDASSMSLASPLQAPAWHRSQIRRRME